MEGRDPTPPGKQFSITSWCPSVQLNLTLSTWRQRQIPQSSRTASPPHPPSSDARPKSRLLPGHLTIWQKVPTTPSLGSINLLEWLSELRKSFYLLDHWFTIEGYNSGTARRKRCTGQGMGEGRSFRAVWVHHSPRISRGSPPRSSEPCPFGVLWRLHYIGMIKSLVIGNGFDP